MNKSIILDFMGVIADPHYKKMIMDSPLKIKFSTLRILAGLKKYPEFKKVFEDYKRGLVDTDTLIIIAQKHCPNSAYVIPKILHNLNKYITISNDVISLVKQLQERDVKIYIMSNTIPETECMIEDANLASVFDGLILSTRLGYVKPEKEIYEYAIKKYALDPKHVLMIDDTKKNLKAAADIGMKTMKCSNSKETCFVLESCIQHIDKVNEMSNK